MKIKRFLAITAALLLGAASAFAVPTVPGGAPNNIGDVAPIAFSSTLNAFTYLQVDSSGNLMVTGTVAAPAGGTAVTAAQMQRNPGDAATTATVLQGISSAITVVGLTSTATTTAIPVPVETTALGIPAPVIFDFTNGGSLGGFQIPVGATNSALFSFTGTSGGANFLLQVEYTEE